MLTADGVLFRIPLQAGTSSDLKAQAQVMEGNILYEWSQVRHSRQPRLRAVMLRLERRPPLHPAIGGFSFVSSVAFALWFLWVLRRESFALMRVAPPGPPADLRIPWRLLHPAGTHSRKTR